MNKKIITLLLLSFILITFTSAYHPGTNTAIQQPVQTVQHPGNTPTYIVIGLIVVITGAIYWKLKYAPNK